MRVFALTLILSAVVFGFEAVSFDNPALSLKDVWAIFGIDVWSNLSEGSNIFRFSDIMDLIFGNEITFDASRLEGVSGDLNLGISPEVGISLGTGMFDWAVIFETKLDGKIGLEIPRSVGEILLEGPDYEENVDETFKLIKGNLFLKGGLTFASRLRWFDLGVSVGVYYPIMFSDPDSSMTFSYLSDPDTGEVRVSVSGEERIFTALNSSGSLDFLNPGVYLDVGLVKKMGIFDFGVSVSNISLLDSRAYNYASAGLSFQATMIGGVPEVQGPEYWVSGIDSLTDPVSVGIPVRFSGFLVADLGILDLGIKGDYTPSVDDWNMGLVLDLLKIVWLDISYSNDGYWRKSAVLDLKLLILRMTLGFGIVDDDLFNFNPERFEGFSAILNFGLGI